jgi:hypothetical protein
MEVVGKEVGDLARYVDRAIPPENMNCGVRLMRRTRNMIMRSQEGEGRMNDDVNGYYDGSIVISPPLEVMFRPYLNGRGIFEGERYSRSIEGSME